MRVKDSFGQSRHLDMEYFLAAFAQGVAAGLGVREDVLSPTYAYVNSYAPMFHFDCYRIGSVRQAEELGFADYFDAGRICLVEWSENIAPLLPADCKKILIRKRGEGERPARKTAPVRRTFDHGYSMGTASAAPAAAAGQSAPAGDFKVGDTVQHKAFGGGLITKLTPMGGDALVEIAFDKVGTKKLMLKSAAQYMKKG